jgi:hypothetical protein
MRHFIPRLSVLLLIAVSAFGADQTAGVQVRGTVTVTQGTASSLKVDLSGTSANATAVKVDGSAAIQPASQSGTWTVQPGNTANSTPWLATDSATSATGSAVPAKAGYIGGNGSGNLTGLIACDNWTPISIVTATTTKIISLASSKNTYICSFHLFSAGTQNAAWISGTKVTNECDTSTAGLAGGTTAATGYNFTAQTGIAAGSGLNAIIRTASTGKDVCIITSGAVQLSGVVNWTQF